MVGLLSVAGYCWEGRVSAASRASQRSISLTGMRIFRPRLMTRAGEDVLVEEVTRHAERGAGFDRVSASRGTGCSGGRRYFDGSAACRHGLLCSGLVLTVERLGAGGGAAVAPGGGAPG